MTAPTQGLLALVLALAAAIGFGLGGYRVWKLYRYMRLGRAEDRTDLPARRVRDELVIYLGQSKLFKRPYLVRGIAHALIFWGFLVITVGTVDLLLNGIFGLHVPGTDSGLFAWTVDLFAMRVAGGDQSFELSMPASARDAFLDGSWDATGLLLENYDEVRALAARLPYVTNAW